MVSLTCTKWSQAQQSNMLGLCLFNWGESVHPGGQGVGLRLQVRSQSDKASSCKPMLV